MSKNETLIKDWSEENLRLTDTFDAIRQNMRALYSALVESKKEVERLSLVIIELRKNGNTDKKRRTV